MHVYSYVLIYIYIPMCKNSVFYFQDIQVSNYGGLLRSAKEKGSRDPRYLIGGRFVPSYYLSELSAGRKRVLETLIEWKVPREKLPYDLSYCPNQGANQNQGGGGADAIHGTLQNSLPGTLSMMPVGPHQPILDPCLTSESKGRVFKETSEYMNEEVAHVPYSDLIRDKFKKPLPSPPPNHGTTDVGGDGGKECEARETSMGLNTMRETSMGLNTLIVHHHIPIVSRYTQHIYRTNLTSLSLPCMTCV